MTEGVVAEGHWRSKGRLLRGTLVLFTRGRRGTTAARTESLSHLLHMTGHLTKARGFQMTNSLGNVARAILLVASSLTVRMRLTVMMAA
jgi:hypothetical protein